MPADIKLPSDAPSWKNTRLEEMTEYMQVCLDSGKIVEGGPVHKIMQDMLDRYRVDPFDSEIQFFWFRGWGLGPYELSEQGYQDWLNACTTAQEQIRGCLDGETKQFTISGTDIYEIAVRRFIEREKQFIGSRNTALSNIDGDRINIEDIPELVHWKKGKVSLSRWYATRIGEPAGNHLAQDVSNLRTMHKFGLVSNDIEVTIDTRPEAFDRIGNMSVDIERTCFRPTREYENAPLLLAQSSDMAVVSFGLDGKLFGRGLIWLPSVDNKPDGLFLFNIYPSTNCAISKFLSEIHMPLAWSLIDKPAYFYSNEDCIRTTSPGRERRHKVDLFVNAQSAMYSETYGVRKKNLDNMEWFRARERNEQDNRPENNPRVLGTIAPPPLRPPLRRDAFRRVEQNEEVTWQAPVAEPPNEQPVPVLDVQNAIQFILNTRPGAEE